MGWHFPEETCVSSGKVERLSLSQKAAPGAIFIVTSVLFFLISNVMQEA